MEQNNLLKIVNEELIDKLYRFCYARTSYTAEAEDLCSDIMYAVVRAGRSEQGGANGGIQKPEAYFWAIAHRVYADYCARRRMESQRRAEGDAQELLQDIPDRSQEEQERQTEDRLALDAICRQIANLSKIYREIVIAFYMDGQPTAQIADKFDISESTVRQRLFSARQEIRNEVKQMKNDKSKKDKMEKPMPLQMMTWCIWGTGNPSGGSPQDVCNRQLSKHVIWLCRNKPNTARAIAEELGVPLCYIEEELEVQVYGTNGRYGTLRKTDSGRYVTNFILLDEGEIAYLHGLYTAQIPKICEVTAKFIEEHKEEYLSCAYLNCKVTLNLILWQQMKHMAAILEGCVTAILQEKYLSDIKPSERPFSIFGYRVKEGDTNWGGGCDGISGEDICGYASVSLTNIYIRRIRKHFDCGHNIAQDAELRMAIRAVRGLSVKDLSETGQEVAARAIEQGYLYREGDMLYTKFLVALEKDCGQEAEITEKLSEFFSEEAEKIAARIAEFVRKKIPEHLRGDYMYLNFLASLPVLDTLVESLIDKGLLTPPENGIGAEGVWMHIRE